MVGFWGWSPHPVVTALREPHVTKMKKKKAAFSHPPRWQLPPWAAWRGGGTDLDPVCGAGMQQLSAALSLVF